MGITQSTRSFPARRAKKRKTGIRYVERRFPRVKGYKDKNNCRVSAPLDAYVEQGVI